MPGIIIKSISGDYDVYFQGKRTICKPLGIFRFQNISPKVGDRVDIEGTKIVKIYPRKNDLTRPSVSNVDKVFIITSFIEPDLNLNLLDRLITLTEWEDISAALVFTKADLIDLTKFQKVLEYYKKLGYPIFVLPQEMELLKQEINDSICVVAGQSGVGKSTLINSMGSLIELKTGKISDALGRGKHTTRHTELLSMGSGWIADTPGFGILDLEMDLQSLSHTFREFFPHHCKFSTCLHLAEPGCQIKDKVASGEILLSRYHHYQLFVEEIKEKRKY